MKIINRNDPGKQKWHYFPKTLFNKSITRAAGSVLIFFSSWPSMACKHQNDEEDHDNQRVIVV